MVLIPMLNWLPSTILSAKTNKQILPKKTLLFNQNSLTESGISGAAWLREHKDLRRYVFKAEFEDAASYQHFNHSKIMASLTANFYSSFNVIYAKGFDED